MQKIIVGKEKVDPYTRHLHMNRHLYKNYTTNNSDPLVQPPVEDIMPLLQFMQKVKAGDCKK